MHIYYMTILVYILNSFIIIAYSFSVENNTREFFILNFIVILHVFRVPLRPLDGRIDTIYITQLKYHAGCLNFFCLHRLN